MQNKAEALLVLFLRFVYYFCLLKTGETFKRSLELSFFPCQFWEKHKWPEVAVIPKSQAKRPKIENVRLTPGWSLVRVPISRSVPIFSPNGDHRGCFRGTTSLTCAPTIVQCYAPSIFLCPDTLTQVSVSNTTFWGGIFFIGMPICILLGSSWKLVCLYF